MILRICLRICLSGTIQTMLEAEIEYELGYAKHSMKDKAPLMLEMDIPKKLLEVSMAILT